ncbi:MAG: proteasome accessory factor PafA2 family protein [Planctomycetes bacterium]|nr:proteasome accessory factor PafA2 family protein [Planctomycetota bacterium]
MESGAPTGIYIDNGSRYYLDSGDHNEVSSPELSTPRQIAVYDRAAEQMLLRAKAALMKRSKPIDICITKNNVNFSMPDRAAWGQHEAYTCWISLAAAATRPPHESFNGI